MIRNLEAVPPTTPIFLDTNILIYGIRHASRQCAAFLERCLNGLVRARSSAVVLSECTHRLMLGEAFDLGLIARPTASAMARVAGRVIPRLHAYEREIGAARATLEAVDLLDEGLLAAARVERRRWGLMTNDSILVAAMRRHGVGLLASADRDFERVEGITLFAPDDL